MTEHYEILLLLLIHDAPDESVVEILVDNVKVLENGDENKSDQMKLTDYD